MFASPESASSARFELRFQSLFDAGRALSFPCDERGRVELDTLSAAARINYFFARTVIGRDFHSPAIVPSRPG